MAGELFDVRVLARSVAGGELSATEVVAAWLRRLRKVDEVTNCVAAWNEDDAFAQAAALDRALGRDGPVRPLHGVPFTVKDWIDVAGVACTGGWVECRDRVPSSDATVVARMRAAGAVVIAKTAVQVDSALYGPVYNPRDPTRSPGASSSGEAAAIAGGGSPLGLASDSGGSIRLPAAWCGVAALKPSAGRVPTTGHFPPVGDRSDGRTQIGPIGSCVRNLIEVLNIIAGPDDCDAGTAPVPLGDPYRLNLTGLRLGWTLGDPTWTPTPAVRHAVERSLALLEGLGAKIVAEIPQHLDEALDITRRYWKRKRSELTGKDAERQLVDWDRYRTRMLIALHDVEAVIMPATTSVAPTHRPMTESDYIFTLPASLTGSPAAVVPVAQEATLPIAVQVVAQPWCDHIALRTAEALEADHAHPPHL